MTMRILILSDIHGNMEALENVLKTSEKYDVSALLLLGDVIDYGPHSNEVIERLKRVEIPILCNILGNHEYAIINDAYDRFSSDRGRASARFTRNSLNGSSWAYMENAMSQSGKAEFVVGGKKCLAIHGSLDDEYWKAIRPGDDLADYKDYDYVFSGHSHFPHYFEEYYKVDNPMTRNKKKTVFINPGSVGQPRNISPLAQFCVWNTETEEVTMAHVPYDIKKEQKAFSKEIDEFYKKRLEVGV